MAVRIHGDEQRRLTALTPRSWVREREQRNTMRARSGGSFWQRVHSRTFSLASKSAPELRSSVAQPRLPLMAAQWSGVQPSCRHVDQLRTIRESSDGLGQPSLPSRWPSRPLHAAARHGRTRDDRPSPRSEAPSIHSVDDALLRIVLVAVQQETVLGKRTLLSLLFTLTSEASRPRSPPPPPSSRRQSKTTSPFSAAS